MSTAQRFVRRLAMRFDRFATLALLLMALVLAAKDWLDAHPGDNPWAPLNLNDPPGWTTERKIAALRDDPAECRAVLTRSAVAFEALEPAGEGTCARPERIVMTGFPLRPASPPTTCAIAAGLSLWIDRTVKPAAHDLLGTDVARIEHFGAYSCRRLYGRATGPWSEHATGNAIDVAAFVLADGRRVSVLRDWPGEGAKSAFLHRVHDGARETFGTVLSPDYNNAHRDHLHLDQAWRGFGGVCR